MSKELIDETPPPKNLLKKIFFLKKNNRCENFKSERKTFFRQTAIPSFSSDLICQDGMKTNGSKSFQLKIFPSPFSLARIVRLNQNETKTRVQVCECVIACMSACVSVWGS